jgi:hypothetical protein
MDYAPFQAKQGGTFVIANAVAASADTSVIDDTCASVLLYNSSLTAIAFYRITFFPTNALGAGGAPTVTTDVPIGPNSRVVVYTGTGYKKIRTIASAADGNVYVVPGNGNSI